MRNNINKKRLYEIPDVSKLRCKFYNANNPGVELYGGARGGGKSWIARHTNPCWDLVIPILKECVTDLSIDGVNSKKAVKEKLNLLIQSLEVE